MTDSKKLDLALSKLDKIDILENEIQELNRHTINIELILKNEINHSIKLLIESQNNVIDKLNQPIFKTSKESPQVSF